MSDDEIIRETREAFDRAADAEAENRREALDDLRFARLGEQWPEKVRRERELDGRPCLTVNRLDPYLRGVVGATSADLDANDARVRAQQDLDLAGSGAFGGSGAALTRSATEGELARARATTLGTLRSQGYAQALGGATSQAQLQQQQLAQRLAAAQQLGTLSSQYDANLRGNIGTQTAVGDDLRGITQAQDQAPVTTAAQIVAMLQGLPIGLFTGSTTNGTENTQTKGQKTEVHAEAGISYLGNPAFGGG